MTDDMQRRLHSSGFRNRNNNKKSREPFGFRDQDGDYLLSHLRSTIGVTKLNFSVRNGKRWNLRAIVTWIPFLMKNEELRMKNLLTCPMPRMETWPTNNSPSSATRWTYIPSFWPAPLSGKPPESLRAISNARLWCLHLYTCILSTSSSLTTLWNLILWPASHLDAFSAYPIPT